MKRLFYLCIYVSGFYLYAWGVWTQPAISYTVFLGRWQSQTPFDWGWKLDFDTPKVTVGIAMPAVPTLNAITVV